jgi:hypothetical protein
LRFASFSSDEAKGMRMHRSDLAERRELGLALRMARESRVISAQHRQLDDFVIVLAAALDADDAGAARVAYERFASALEAHFALEERFYFPALRGLRPALGSALEALEGEHQALGERLAGLGRLAEAGDCAACLGLLERFAGELAEHEGREEGLLASLRSGGTVP